MNDALPWLIPTPRSFVRVPGILNLPDSVILPGAHAPANLDEVGQGLVSVLRIDRTRAISSEAYRLTINPSLPIVVEASSAAGTQHALVTLVQLLRQFGRELPCAVVEDEPAFANRGVMLDVSRDRVPTMPELLAFVDTLAELKINHLQ